MMDAQVAKVRPITIAIVALGGEGGGVLADWIVDLGQHAAETIGREFDSETQIQKLESVYLELIERTSATKRD